MAKLPASAAADARPLWEQNGMTEAEWEALSPDARAWRTEHPRAGADVHQAPADKASASVGGAAAAGAQVVLSGDAQAAARGELHRSIEHNTTARDEAPKPAAP